jgi:RNase P/RNase MRP subunit POP5
MKLSKKKLALKPTLKERRHYVVFECENTNEKEIKESISHSLLNYVGLLGFAKAGMMFIDFQLNKKNKNNLYCITSITTKYVDSLKNAIIIFKEFPIECIGVSGTIKKAKKFYK